MMLDAALLELTTTWLCVLQNNGIAVHVVQEFISPGRISSVAPSRVTATNIYREYAARWRLFEHHTSVPGVRGPMAS